MSWRQIYWQKYTTFTSFNHKWLELHEKQQALHLTVDFLHKKTGQKWEWYNCWKGLNNLSWDDCKCNLNIHNNHYNNLFPITISTPRQKFKQLTWGLQYSSSQLKTHADNSVKLATDIDALNVWKRESIVALNCNVERGKDRDKHNASSQ